MDPVETVRRDWDTYKSRPAAFLALAVLCLLGGYVAARWVYEAEIRHLTVQVEELKAKRAVPSAIAPQKNAAERRAVEQKVDQVLVAIAKARSDSGKSRTTDRDRAGGRLQKHSVACGSTSRSSDKPCGRDDSRDRVGRSCVISVLNRNLRRNRRAR